MKQTKKQIKKLFIDALTNHLGNVSKACAELGICRKTYYGWRKADAAFADEADKVQEYVLDEVEDCLMRQIKAGEVQATIFYLKCRGKGRGYVEKQQIEAEVKVTETPMTQSEAKAVLADFNKLEEEL